MLMEHGQRLEADFQRFYNLDLADLYRGRLGVRKAAVLALNLPPESAVMRAEGGDGALTYDEHLLREVSHKLSMLLYQGGGGKGSKPQPPKAPPKHLEKKRKQSKLQNAAERSRRMAQKAQQHQQKNQQNPPQ